MSTTFDTRVTATRQLSASMVRITVSIPSVPELGPASAGDYVKLHLENQEGDQVKRTYTIRDIRPERREMDIDFVLHGGGAVAAEWAREARVGDTLRLSGPGKGKRPSDDNDWLFIAGDLSALPAISVILESLPASARGYAVLQAGMEADQIPLNHPRGVDLRWHFGGGEPASAEVFVDYLKSIPWLEGDVAIWAASDFDTMRAMRGYFKKERKVATANAYVSSYWKRGVREDEHKKIKREDTEQQTAA